MLDYVQNPDTFLFQVTSWIGDHIVQYGLVPFRNFLVETPWPVTLVGITLISLVVSGRRSAITTFLMLALIGVIGEWSSAMDTASQVLVATVLTVVIGVGLGVWAAESRTFSRILRPVNDVLQTLPQLVYLIPLIYLMPVSVVPGVIAGVLYAFPVVARLVESGVRNVEANTVEAAESFGATRRQILRKVKIPLAQDAIMLGVNQGIIMVLAVVVIGGLVGSPGLGYEVAQGLARSDFGLGVLASLAILALGIALDRVTRGARRAQQSRDAVTSSGWRAADGRPLLRSNQQPRRVGCPKEMVDALGARSAGARRRRARSAVSASAFAGSSAKSCGTVTMDENAWAGATANVYVLKYVLEKNLGCKVNIEKLPESTPLFQAMADGKVDVVPEDWNNIDLKVNQKYRQERDDHRPRLERRDRPHRLVHPDVPDEAVSRSSRRGRA